MGYLQDRGPLCRNPLKNPHSPPLGDDGQSAIPGFSQNTCSQPSTGSARWLICNAKGLVNANNYIK